MSQGESPFRRPISPAIPGIAGRGLRRVLALFLLWTAGLTWTGAALAESLNWIEEGGTVPAFVRAWPNKSWATAALLVVALGVTAIALYVTQERAKHE